MKGVSAAVVDVPMALLSVDFDADVTGARDIISALRNQGFAAQLQQNSDARAQLEVLKRSGEITSWRRAMITSIVFAIPLMFIAHILMELYVVVINGVLLSLPTRA